MTPGRVPDFDQLLTVLRCGRPDRPVPFEFIVDPVHLKVFLGDAWQEGDSTEAILHNWVTGFAAAGYDYATLPLWLLDILQFPKPAREFERSLGMAHGGVITDRQSLEAYPWPDPEIGDYEILDLAASFLIPGQKIVMSGPGGVLENVTNLAGYEDLVMLLEDDPETAKELFDNVGWRLLRFYEKVVDHPAIGAVIVNDDWGFKTQPFFRVETMQEYVFPWKVQIVDRIHGAGKPAILHSCGNLEPLWDDILDGIRIDAKHSFEDTILPVEDAYERFCGRMAILGGIDVNFLCSSTLGQIETRCRSMLERSASRGGYALGSGNSIPYYVPFENYLAMLRVGLN
ncbi:MAG: uroporphyrinogen decarboxylase family protein [Fimbriimonas sp.]|nr:uroporphyrinogen decarboxylase family protein [Fimbriimonas sp.]